MTTITLPDDLSTEEFHHPSTWPTLRATLHQHPNPITRHEACFVAGELNITELIPDLQRIAQQDSSIVVRHEAIEALGRMKNDVAILDAFLCRLIENPSRDPMLDHNDITATIEIARQRLAQTKNSL